MHKNSRSLTNAFSTFDVCCAEACKTVKVSRIIGVVILRNKKSTYMRYFYIPPASIPYVS